MRPRFEFLMCLFFISENAPGLIKKYIFWLALLSSRLLLEPKLLESQKVTILQSVMFFPKTAIEDHKRHYSIVPVVPCTLRPNLGLVDQ